MKQQRPKQPEWSKPFKIIEKRQEFTKIDMGEDGVVPVRAQPQKKKQKETKKQDIVVPKIDVLNKSSRVINELGIPLNYIRITQRLNLPKIDKYELSQVDFIFLLTNENKYQYGGRKVLTVDFLERAIAQLELLAGKDSTVLPKDSDKKLKGLIEREYDYIIGMDNYEEFVKLVNTHWRNRRQELKTPLLRVLWKPNPEDNSHYLAFRPREKDEKEKKKQLRRHTKPTEEETIMNLEGIQKEFEDAVGIADRIRMREYLKLQKTTLKLRSMNQGLKVFKENLAFNPAFDKGELAKQKETLAKMAKQFQSRKALQQPDQKLQQQTVQNSNLAIVNFLATLCHKCLKINVDADSIINGTPSTKSLTPTLSTQPSSLSTSYPPPIHIQKVQSSISKQPREEANICSFAIRQLKVAPGEVFLERDFDEYKRAREYGVEYQEEVRGMEQYFNERHKMIKSVYFFEEDEEEFKEVRKNTSSNFKRWKETKA